MKQKKYPCASFPHLIHGADYNPEQWIDDMSVWDKDMELMQLANCNEMSVGIFSWAKLEPREGEYDFSFLDKILDKIHANGGKVILATPSGARPHWMADRYPEVLRVDPRGQRQRFGGRHNHCYTSPIYREKVHEINTLLAQRYGKHPAVIGWHVSNEYSGDCHCPHCAQAFRDFLKEKFHGDIGTLNRAYWTTFWSHTYDSFDQIDPPSPISETSVHGLNLDWRRFVTRQTMDFIQNECRSLRQLTPSLPVTINMMFEFMDLDYHKIADVIDFASWDSYPEWHNGDDALIAQKTAFWHDLYRSLKGKPFLLMESTPSCVNWKPYNKPKRPGLDVLSSIQAVAHGSDSVQYFQWRKSRGSCEKFHGAVVGHDGTADTRVFRSVQETGRILKTIDEIAGTMPNSKAAVIFDWENMWALNDCQGYSNVDKKYFETCYAYHKQFWQRGIDCDVIAPDADLSKYKIVVAPMLYMTGSAVVENLKQYVAGGGTLYATYTLGTVDENDLCHLGGLPCGELKEVFGIWAEEIDVLYPQERQYARCGDKLHQLIDYCEVVHLRGAQALATYADGYYEGRPAVTIHPYCKGQAIYQACRDTGSLADEIMDQILSGIGLVGNIASSTGHGVTAQSRTDGERTYLFVQNYSATETAQVQMRSQMRNMLTGEIEETATLPPYGFAIYTNA